MTDILKVASENNTPKTFKNPHYRHPTRRVKPLKQLIVDEQKHLKTLQLKNDPLVYFSMEAPPSVKPVKKYCDITGLKGNYKSPSSGIRYHNAEVYTVVKNMAQGVDQQYLELRNANTVLR
jgi:INO80 complex subunit C